MDKILHLITSVIYRFVEIIYNRFFFTHIFNHPSVHRVIQNEFHKLYYTKSSHTWRNTYWLGAQTLKVPLDLWIYQEIIKEVQPDIIIETGTAQGGSALYMATILDALGKGKIITIDIKKSSKRPQHKRIHYLKGSSLSKKIIKDVISMIRSRDKVMVVLDSNHAMEHVYAEMLMYHSFVTKNSYLVVEDTHMHGFPVRPSFPIGGGPMEAVKLFLSEYGDFVVDTSREKFLLTFFPSGFLKKIA
jgi:cephalosporin hydroxylase